MECPYVIKTVLMLHSWTCIRVDFTQYAIQIYKQHLIKMIYYIFHMLYHVGVWWSEDHYIVPYQELVQKWPPSFRGHFEVDGRCGECHDIHPW